MKTPVRIVTRFAYYATPRRIDLEPELEACLDLD